MAKVITRTVTRTICECLAVNLETEQPVTITVSVNGKFNSESKLRKAVTAKGETENIKIVKITGIEIKSELREMDEDAFIENSRFVVKKK